jgi:hypothetical protein
MRHTPGQKYEGGGGDSRRGARASERLALRWSAPGALLTHLLLTVLARGRPLASSAGFVR